MSRCQVSPTMYVRLGSAGPMTYFVSRWLRSGFHRPLKSDKTQRRGLSFCIVECRMDRGDTPNYHTRTSRSPTSRDSRIEQIFLLPLRLHSNSRRRNPRAVARPRSHPGPIVGVAFDSPKGGARDTGGTRARVVHADERLY